jgi:hypothetical protein
MGVLLLGTPGQEVGKMTAKKASTGATTTIIRQ